MPTVKNVGEPCAGEPHARFEVAAGGNQASRASTCRGAQAPLADPTKPRYAESRVMPSGACTDRVVPAQSKIDDHRTRHNHRASGSVISIGLAGSAGGGRSARRRSWAGRLETPAGWVPRPSRSSTPSASGRAVRGPQIVTPQSSGQAGRFNAEWLGTPNRTQQGKWTAPYVYSA